MKKTTDVTMSLAEIVERSQGERHEYPAVFEEYSGLDIVLPEKKLHAVPSWGRESYNLKRRATLCISTFRGTSANAIHFYGKVEIQGVHMEIDGEPGHSVMDMRLEQQYPLSGYSYELTLRRPVTQADKDADREARCPADIRFKCAHVGDLTDRWNTTEELIAFAKEVFRARFKGDWEFQVDYAWRSGSEKLSL